MSASEPAGPTPTDAPLLSVEELKVAFATEEGIVEAVDGVTFELRAGEVLAVVGSVQLAAKARRPTGRIAKRAKKGCRTLGNRQIDVMKE